MVKSISLFSILALALCFVAALFVSCSKSDPKPEFATEERRPAQPTQATSVAAPISSAKFDLVIEFERIVSNLRTNLVALRKDPTDKFQDDISYDIKRTDSLLDPIIGVIRLKRTQNPTETKLAKDAGTGLAFASDDEITLAPKNGAWVLIALESKSDLIMILKGKRFLATSGERVPEPRKRISPGTEDWKWMHRLLFENNTP